MSNEFAPVPELLAEIKAGRMIILVDDADRENEGDLVMAAEQVTPEAVNFMARYGRGLICLTLTQQKADQLALRPMVSDNTAPLSTNFTVSVDAREGITTGISAADRARTVRVAVQENAEPSDLVRPGHVFPLIAKPGGVLVRIGHTEGSVDLAEMAGLAPAGVICEIMNEDGTMARLPELRTFAAEHGLKIGCIADLIRYRRQKERLIERVSSTRLPTKYGEFMCHLYKSKVDHYLHVALCCGKVQPRDGEAAPRIDHPVLVRVHSECLTGETFGSLRCECADQLSTALKMIQEAGEGVLVYIREEGRGIGLENKLKAYALQDQGLDTVEANEHLGLNPDMRDYGTGSQILADLGIGRMRLMTNNPKKYAALEGYGLEIVERVPVVIPSNPHNEQYLKTKMEKMGHLFP